MKYRALPACALILLIVWGASACKRSSALPDLLFISIDTLRADHLSCYGYKKIQTPTIDRLAGQGLRFNQAMTPAPITLPSHASMFTGLVPLRHGARDNGIFQLTPEAWTLAEILKDKGYQTAAVVGAFVLDKRFGLDQGFDIYTDEMPIGRKKTKRFFAEINAAEVTDRAIQAWNQMSAKQPRMIWVHYFDPHAPYAPPEQYRAEGRSDYDSEILYTDAQLNRLLNALGSERPRLVVLVGDHGESLGQYGEFSHGIFLYQPTVRVPLILTGLDDIQRGMTIEEPVSTVDLLPTLLQMLSLDIPQDIDGRSLLPAIQSDTLSSAPIYLETEMPFYQHGWHSLAGVRQGSLKYIEAPRAELYDLSTDPREEKNIMDQRPDAVRELQKQLKMWRAKSRFQTSALELNADQRARLESLGYVKSKRALEDKTELLDPKDAKPILKLTNDLGQSFDLADWPAVIGLAGQILSLDPSNIMTLRRLAAAQRNLGLIADAEKTLRGLVALRPDDTDILTNLGVVLADQGRPEEAIELLATLEDSVLVTGEYYFTYGKLLHEKGLLEKAFIMYKKALDYDPEDVWARYNLAGVLGARGDLKAAVAELEAAIEVDPGFTAAHLRLAEIYEKALPDPERARAHRKAAHP